MSDSHDEYLMNDEVAAHFKVSPWTVRKWRSQGSGPPGVKVGRHVRYLRSACDRWAADLAASQQGEIDAVVKQVRREPRSA
jgi:predicted DNA-binding transcriptional regulator AlpA